MIEQVFVLCDNGMVMVHDLPLPSGVADRVAKGQLRLVNEDGSPIVDQQAEAEAPVDEETQADEGAGAEGGSTDDPPALDVPVGDEAPVDAEGEESPAVERPAVAALKAEWVAYAVAQGMTEADADAMTKADLIELFSAK
jgi:hypothetical protein